MVTAWIKDLCYRVNYEFVEGLPNRIILKAVDMVFYDELVKLNIEKLPFWLISELTEKCHLHHVYTELKNENRNN